MKLGRLSKRPKMECESVKNHVDFGNQNQRRMDAVRKTKKNKKERREGSLSVEPFTPAFSYREEADE